MAVADTGPLNYLAWIGWIEVLPRIRPRVAVPAAVLAELRQERAPPTVRVWANALPHWVEVHPDPPALPDLTDLDQGERAAIGLVPALGADLLLVDERRGTAAARRLGIETIGTLGLLARAADRGLLDLDCAFAALRATNFRAPPELYETLLAEDRARRDAPGP